MKTAGPTDISNNIVDGKLETLDDQEPYTDPLEYMSCNTL